jgi:glutathione S-transferase
MHTFELTYFDIHGGRGEVARMAFFMAGIPYEDRRVKFQEWAALKPTTPYAAIPVLKIDGKELAQSNAINRYVGKLAGLYPEDALEAAFCDEVMDAVEEITIQVGATMRLKDEAEKKVQREALAAGSLRFYIERVEQRLLARGGKYFAGDALSVADLKVYLWIRHLKSGTLDYLPTDLADRIGPQLVAHYERVKAEPKVAAYNAMRGLT